MLPKSPAHRGARRSLRRLQGRMGYSCLAEPPLGTGPGRAAPCTERLLLRAGPGAGAERSGPSCLPRPSGVAAAPLPARPGFSPGLGPAPAPLRPRALPRLQQRARPLSNSRPGPYSAPAPGPVRPGQPRAVGAGSVPTNPRPSGAGGPQSPAVRGGWCRGSCVGTFLAASPGRGLLVREGQG